MERERKREGGERERELLIFLTFHLCIHTGCVAADPLPELAVPELQQRVLTSRHNPLCVFFRVPGKDTQCIC